MNTATEILAKQLAAGYFLRSPDDRAVEDYDIAMSMQAAEEFQKVLDINENSGLTIDNVTGLQSMMASLSATGMVILNQYARYIKNGLMFKVMTGRLEGDANAWDVQQMATIGYNLAQVWRLKNETFAFEPNRLAWVSRNSNIILQADPRNGLPLHPLTVGEET